MLLSFNVTTEARLARTSSSKPSLSSLELIANPEIHGAVLVLWRSTAKSKSKMRRWCPSFVDPRLYKCDARLYSARKTGSSRARPYDSRVMQRKTRAGPCDAHAALARPLLAS
eukprot:2839351-Pleurochrysis_carterae.AAC.1